MRVFFYGLFMDKALLEKKGVKPTGLEPAYVEDFALQIGERATLAPLTGARAYGVVMCVADRELMDLYSEESVKDYKPETLKTVLSDGRCEDVICYNLPKEEIAGSNADYARALYRLAQKLGFPKSYLDEIEKTF